MKRHSTWTDIVLTLAVVLPLTFATATRASTDAPMFAGETITIPGVGEEEEDKEYTWESAEEDGIWHIDTYTLRRSEPLIVTGKIGFPNLATAKSGEAPDFEVDGFLQNSGSGSVYKDKVQITSEDIDLTVPGGGGHWTSRVTTTTSVVSLSTGEVTSSSTNQYFRSDGNNFTVAADGALSGAMSGYFVDDVWYLNQSGPMDWTQIGATNYSYKKITHSRSGNGPVVSEEKYYVYVYEGDLSTPNLIVDTDGTVHGLSTGFKVDGTWYLNGPLPVYADYYTPNDQHYDYRFVTAAYSRNENGQVTSAQTGYYTSGGGSPSFYLNADGTVSGSESGMVVNGTLYLDYLHDTSDCDYTSPDGRHYAFHALLTSYTPDGNGGVTSSVSDYYAEFYGRWADANLHSYTPPRCTFFIAADGTISGSETGVKINGTMYVNYAHAPATLMIGSNLWRYTGQGANNVSLYQGMTTGQQLTLGAPDPNNADGNRSVIITAPITNAVVATGTFNDVRGSARLSDGSELYSGNTAGERLNPALNESNLHTIAADLDITGNVITFGSLNGNAAMAGATLHFQDVADTASLYSILARPQAQWIWSRTVDSSGQTTVPVMKLDTTHNLMLYDPTDPSSATVKLSPNTGAVSELPRLKLTHQTTLEQDGSSVLTQAIGDTRYLRTLGSGGSQNFALNGSLNINTGTSGSSNNSLPTEANAVTIGQNLNAGSGQVVVGRYNATPTSDDLFVVGAGTSEQTKNALSVSTSGNTQVTGGLTVAGAASLSSATVSGQDVLTKGQTLRVYPAGDLPMDAAFKTVPSGVTAPSAP
ncbi:MAG: hypothetical protein JWR15_1655 [Prosthecobacter sp.]|nr:hypothetical protein [Prosthecobacter sp.]